MILVGNFEETIIQQAFNNSLWSALDKYYREVDNLKYRYAIHLTYDSISLTHTYTATDGFHYSALNLS